MHRRRFSGLKEKEVRVHGRFKTCDVHDLRNLTSFIKIYEEIGG